MYTDRERSGDRVRDVDNRKSLLIVDDVELFIQLQISHLGRKRYNIHTARSGAEGLRLARALKPDLILLDLFMPDLNGDEICRTLKQDPETASIPVVLISSGARGRSRAATVSSECDGLLFKPVRRDLLLMVVENLLGTNLRHVERVSTAMPGTAVLDEEKHPVTLRSLSCEGAFVEISQHVIRGDLMELSFTVPGQEEEINVRTAAVVWSGTLGVDGPAGAGLYFLTIEDGMKKKIDGFVRQKITRSTLPSGGSTASNDRSR